jgi:hypothetical protein
MAKMFDPGAAVEIVIHACEFSIVVGRGVLRLFGVRQASRGVASLVGLPLCLLAAVLLIWGIIAWVTS